MGRKNETIQNTGNHILPEGTQVQWNVKATATDTLSFIAATKRNFFIPISTSDFVFTKQIVKPISYTITASNNPLKDYEQLQFSLDVVKDEFPAIQVVTNIDSISRGMVQFAGQISDDYGLQKLQLVYFEKENPTKLEELTNETCRWPIGHPYEEKFYFCGRKPMEKFPYCKLHVLYAFQPKNAKEEDQITEEDIPKFIEKKIKSA